MIKKSISFSISLLLLFFTVGILLPFLPSAATYTDTFSGTSPSVTYQNLTPTSFSTSGWKQWNSSNGLVLSFQNKNQSTASVTYQVQGCERITVGVFTYAGSFVSLAKDGALVLGVHDAQNPFPSSKVQASYSPSTDRVYTTVSGNQMAEFDSTGNRLVFTPVSSVPTDLIDYGVNISVSSNGSSFRSVSPSWQRGEFNGLCYEEFSVSIPSNTVAIQVELNGMREIPKKGGGSYSGTSRMTMLGNVELSGANIVLGAQETNLPEAVITTPAESSENPTSSEKSTSSSSKSSSAGSSSTKSSGTGAGNSTGIASSSSSRSSSTPTSKPESTSSKSSASGSTTKFEGTLNGNPESQDATSSSSSPTSSSSSQGESQLFEEAGNAPQIYTVSNGESDSFSAWVVVYIVIACAIILLILLRPHLSGKK